MKILLVSLLRLGDILLHRELARSIKRQYPGCELHFLIYSQFRSAQALLPEVDHWHHVDRQSMQRILVEREQSPLGAYTLLEEVIENVNSRGFDLILNATHNRFSVRLMDLFIAKEKRGVRLESGRKALDQNKWQTYFNENFSERRGSRFHYLEVLQKALGLEAPLPHAAESRGPGLILLQLLTSDPKKNWGLQRFRDLKMKLESAFPQHRVLGLCSPQEKDEIEKVFQWNEFITPNLEEARNLLKEASLLITGDTSIQHLATQQGCPVVSLFLGSADPIKTSPWQMGAWVIQGQSACAPCAHSEPCHQKEHLCAQSLSTQSVFDLIAGLLRGEAVRIAKGKVFETKRNGASFLVDDKSSSFEAQLEQTVWSVYLDGLNGPVEFPAVPNHEQLRAIRAKHSSFQTAIAKLSENKISLETVELNFPMWKDSLLRYKQDPKAIQETLALCGIRGGILNRLFQEKEVSLGGNTKQFAQERLAET